MIGCFDCVITLLCDWVIVWMEYIIEEKMQRYEEIVSLQLVFYQQPGLLDIWMYGHWYNWMSG